MTPKYLFISLFLVAVAESEKVTDDDSQFYSAWTTSVPLFLILVGLFSLMHSHFPEYYQTKWKPESGLPDPSTLKIWELFAYLWKLDDHQLLPHIGVDGVAFLHCLWMMFEVCLLMFPLAMFVLMPVYSGGDESTSGETLPTLTIGNVENKSGALWASFFAELCLCVFLSLRIGHVYRVVASFANEYHTRNDDAAHAVLIANIEKDQPKYVKDDVWRSDLEQQLKNIYGDELVRVVKTKKLDKFGNLWDDFVEKDECYVRCEKTGKTQGFGIWEKDETMLREEVNEAESKLQEVDYENLKDAPVAFALFRTLRAATECSNSSLYTIPYKFTTVIATGESDIQWKNVHWNRKERSAGEWLTTICYILLIILYSPLMIFVQAVANLDSIAESWSAADAFLDLSTGLRAFLTGLCPILIYQLFFLFLPNILYHLSGYAVPLTKSEQENAALKKHADSLIGMGLLVTFLAGGVLQDIDKLGDPAQWIDLLSTEVPRNSTFFISLIFFSGLLGLGLEISQVVTYIVDLLGFWEPPEFQWYVYFPTFILYFAITCTYAVISPLIMIPSILYFFLLYFTYLYRILYCYKLPFDSGGKLLPAIVSRLYSGIWISQLVLIGLFTLKEGYVQSALMLVMLFTVSSFQTAQRHLYADSFIQGSLTSVYYADEAKGIHSFDEDAYVYPGIQFLKSGKKPEVQVVMSSRSSTRSPSRTHLLEERMPETDPYGSLSLSKD